jgi:hypothetical protein
MAIRESCVNTMYKLLWEGIRREGIMRGVEGINKEMMWEGRESGRKPRGEGIMDEIRRGGRRGGEGMGRTGRGEIGLGKGQALSSEAVEKLTNNILSVRISTNLYRLL